MADIAIITLIQTDYNLIRDTLTMLDIKPISVKILPDDSLIRDNELYKTAYKEHKKARDKYEDVRFQLTTNK